MKIKTLINEGVEIVSTVMSTGEDHDQVAKLLENLEELVGEGNSILVNDENDSVAGYIVHKSSICRETVRKAN